MQAQLSIMKIWLSVCAQGCPTPYLRLTLAPKKTRQVSCSLYLPSTKPGQPRHYGDQAVLFQTPKQLLFLLSKNK